MNIKEIRSTVLDYYEAKRPKLSNQEALALDKEVRAGLELIGRVEAWRKLKEGV